jgi:hypothetical protein
MHVAQVAAAGNTNVTAVNKRRRETSCKIPRADMWSVHVSVKHAYTSKLILACHNWNGVQIPFPSPSQYGPTVNATQAVFNTTEITKQNYRKSRSSSWHSFVFGRIRAQMSVWLQANTTDAIWIPGQYLKWGMTTCILSVCSASLTTYRTIRRRTVQATDGVFNKPS